MPKEKPVIINADEIKITTAFFIALKIFDEYY